MGASNIRDHRAYGQAILDRLAEITVPATIKRYAAALRVAHAGYDDAASMVEEARQERDAALEAVGEADDVLDGTVEELATEIAGARLGTRQNPFQDFSRHSPSALIDLPYAEEVKQVKALLAKLGKKRPPSAVAKTSARCLRDAKAVEAALSKLTKPQAAYTKSIAARDALLPALTKAVRKLKKHGAAAWDEDEATYKAVFAPPAAVQAPKKRRAARAAAAETGATVSS